MASEWPEFPLSSAPIEIIDGDRGKNYPKTSDFTKSGYCLFLNTGNVTTEGFNFSQCQYISEEKDNILRKGKLSRNDVVMTTRGTVGNVAHYNCKVPYKNIRINSGMVIFRPDTNHIVPRFLYLVLRSMLFKKQVAALRTGSAQPQLPIRDINRIRMPIPPINEQQAIACIMGTLDDKIELNRRMNETLEGIARAIFKSWFVDFDPVHAKAEVRPTGLPPEIDALFPDSFQDSELGRIPKGWKVSNLHEQLTVNRGLSYKGQYLCKADEGLPMHNLNSVHEGGGYKYEGIKHYKGDYRPAHLLEAGDVIVTNTEQGFEHLLIGYPAIVPNRYGKAALFSHHIYRLRPRKNSYLPSWFFYLLLRTQRFHQLVAGYSNGTTVNMLPPDGLQKPCFVLPQRDLVERFDKYVIPALERSEKLYEENCALGNIRDVLLPKLLSGALRIPDSEKQLRSGCEHE